MNKEQILLIIILVLLAAIILIPLYFLFRIYAADQQQEEHSVLRNYPILGKARYIIEKLGPELRQYLFLNNNEGKPFSRNDYRDVVVSGKYKSRLIGFGSQRDFDQSHFYIQNALFPKQVEELDIDQSPKVSTMIYHIDNEALVTRKEHREEATVDPYYLTNDHTVVLGETTCREPFTVKGLVGQSAMSFGALGRHAITALSKGLGMAGGTWMNTGEGGLSDHHLKGNPDIIFQIGPGLFGVRTNEGDFSWEELKKKADLPQIKAFELKLAQGAKTRGGHVDGSKVNEEIAKIRNVEPWKTINSPNRFEQFGTAEEMLDFIEKIRDITGKPVGMKIVVGNVKDLQHLVHTMASRDQVPDFITVDGGEGGTGATYQELADAAGLPLFSALPLVDEFLKHYQIRHKTKLIASGKLVTPDKMAVALGLGADLINTARGFMISVGCIMAQVCHNNNCPVGVATTDEKKQNALVVEEKMYRVANYVISSREALYNLAAAAGVTSPNLITEDHIIYRSSSGQVITGVEYKKQLIENVLKDRAIKKSAKRVVNLD